MNSRQQAYFNEINQIIITKGGKLVSDIYIDSKTNVLVECKEGYQ